MAARACASSAITGCLSGQVCQPANQCTTGTTSCSSSTAAASCIVSQKDLQAIVAKGAVADVCLRYFDAAGRPVGTSLDGRVLGIELPAFLAIPRRVAVAGGPEKVPAIRGALAGRLINVLVSDEDTARALLEG